MRATKFVVFFAFPALYSPKAAAFASFSRITGTPNFSDKYFVSGTFSKPRFTAAITVPVSTEITPGLPIPTKAKSDILRFAKFAASIAVFATSSKISSQGRGHKVGFLASETISYFSFTTAATMFVPPKSIPR